MLEGSAKLAHRIAWEACESPIPQELTVDHLCFNKLCINPRHMEIVTRSENSRRGNQATRREKTSPNKTAPALPCEGEDNQKG